MKQFIYILCIKFINSKNIIFLVLIANFSSYKIFILIISDIILFLVIFLIVYNKIEL